MGDVSEHHQWRGRPWLSRVLRLLVVGLPLVIVVLAAWRIHVALGAPVDRTEAILRWVALSVASTIALIGLDRLARQLLPLATLLQLSLIFPDRAPSRFSVALRQNTTRRLQRDVEAGKLEPGTPQEAAEQLLALVAQLSRHDRLTRGHAERVRAYADLIGQELDLDAQQRGKLQWGALLHDIGKLNVPAEILRKTGKPTSREWTTLRNHPDEGWKLIAPLRPWLGEWSRATRDHHERWDGTGYPRRTAGAQISRAGRIVAVVDAFDVMTSARSYKEPISIAEARAELTRCAGAQFDADIVRAFHAVSLGRLRLVAGPLSWLAQLPAIGSIPAAQLPAAAFSVAAAASMAVTAAIVPLPADPLDESAARVVFDDPVISPFDLPGGIPTRTPDVAEEDERASSTTTTTEADPSTTTTLDPTSTTADTTTTTTTTQPPASSSSVAPTTTAPTTTAAPTTTTTSAPTTTTTPATTTTVNPIDLTYLGSNGTGPASIFLPFGGSPSGALANFDSDLNTDPGRTVRRSNNPMNTLDVDEIQAWSLMMNADFRAVGTPVIDIWAAVEEFDLSKEGWIQASFVVCNQVLTSCDIEAQATRRFRQADFGNGFGRVTIPMPAIDVTIPAGHFAVVAITAPNESDRDLWLAFDSAAHQSFGYLAQSPTG